METQNRFRNLAVAVLYRSAVAVMAVGLVAFLTFEAPALAQSVSSQATLTATLPSAPTGLGAAVVGTPGQASACYWVVVNYVGGGVLSPFPACRSDVPNTLGGGNSARISWNGMQGAVTYDVLKTTTNVGPHPGDTVALATGLTATSETDSGGGLSPYTIATFHYPVVSATLRLNNRDYAVPQVEVIGFPLTLASQNGQGNVVSVSRLVDVKGNPWLIPSPTAGAVDYATLANAAAGGTVRLGAAGPDAAIPINIAGKGAGGVSFGTATTGFDPTGALLNGVYSVEATVTLAELNAGQVLVAAETGRTLKVVHGVVQALGGATGTCTDVRIGDTANSPVASLTILQAALTQNTVVNEASANVTLGAFGATALTAAKGIQVYKTGSACD